MSQSRFSRWTMGEKRIGHGFASFLKEAATDQPGGNPTGPGSVEPPAQTAQRMGLVSDGHGSYSDPNTGQIVARTVNGELVFYDGGQGGGATSDGEGGGQTASDSAAVATPTFTDPETGMVKIPSAKPETPEDMAAVPDPVPATAPKDFAKFMKDRSDAIKAGEAQNPSDVPEAPQPVDQAAETKAEVQQQQAELGLQPQEKPQDQLDPVTHLTQPVDKEGGTTSLASFLDKQKKEFEQPI